MARHLEALRQKGTNAKGMPPTKPTKPGSVSFVSSPSLVIALNVTMQESIRYARSEAELDGLVEEIQIEFEAGHLTQAQAERLAHIVVDTARQLEHGLVNIPLSAFLASP